MTTLSIRVTCYWGDFDDLDDIYLIGPYGSAAERDRDLNRLGHLPGNTGLATFAPSRLDPAGADYRMTPQELAAITDMAGLIDVFAIPPSMRRGAA